MADVIQEVKDVASKVGHFFHVVEGEVSAAFVAVFGKGAAHEFSVAAKDALRSAEGQLALEVVNTLQSLKPAPDGASKRAQAFSALKSKFEEQGKQVGSEVLYLLIELAVNAVKGNFKV